MKIAFLFLICDKLHHPDLWKKFFESQSNYGIYVHYKTDNDIGWFNQFKLERVIQTKWGDISLVKAMNLLLETALQCEADMFIFLSEFCIPVKSYEYIADRLDVRYSYFSFMADKNIFPRCDKVLDYLSAENIKKASQWCILNRKHANYIVTHTMMLQWFDGIPASDEHCYVTAVWNQYQDEIVNMTTTYVIWADKFKNRTQGYLKLTPKHYILFDHDELNWVIKCKNLLFARKVDENCVISYNSFDSFELYADKLIGDINNYDTMQCALTICRENSYGGMVWIDGVYYFKQQTTSELVNNKFVNPNATLIIPVTIDEYLIHNNM